MPEYRVKWEIDIIADSPQEAAMIAWGVQHDPESIASNFEIDSELIDVLEPMVI